MTENRAAAATAENPAAEATAEAAVPPKKKRHINQQKLQDNLWDGRSAFRSLWVPSSSFT